MTQMRVLYPRGIQVHQVWAAASRGPREETSLPGSDKDYHT